MSFSISEILVVLLIALLVIKPEQLPEVAHAFARFAHYINNIFKKFKSEVGSFIDSVERPERKREH